MLPADFRRLLAEVMREQELTTWDAAQLCGIAYPTFVQLFQGPTTVDLATAERIMARLGIGLTMTRTRLRREVTHYIVAQTIAGD
jgi:predicted transcriptional regulator